MASELKDAINALRWIRPQRMGSIRVAHPFIQLVAQMRSRGDLGWQATLRQKDEWQRGLLHHAAEFGVTPALQPLLEAGAAIDARDHLGNTPLHWAAQAGQMAFVSDLLERGADPTIENDAGKTPQQVAPARCYWAMSRLVSEHRQAQSGLALQTLAAA